MLLDRKTRDVLQDHLEGHHRDLVVLAVHALVDLLLQMQLHKIQLKPFQKFGEDLAHPDLSSLDFVISEDSLEDVDHLPLDGHLADVLADDGDQSPAGYL